MNQREPCSSRPHFPLRSFPLVLSKSRPTYPLCTLDKTIFLHRTCNVQGHSCPSHPKLTPRSKIKTAPRAGDLNAVAPLVTMLLVLCYGFVNGACFIMAGAAHKPSPHLKHYSTATTTHFTRTYISATNSNTASFMEAHLGLLQVLLFPPSALMFAPQASQPLSKSVTHHALPRHLACGRPLPEPCCAGTSIGPPGTLLGFRHQYTHTTRACHL